MNSLGIVRFRRGPESSTLLAGQSTFFATRNGGAVIEAVRFATAFFGKGQFVAPTIEKQGGRYILRQRLEAGYYQPLDPPQRVTSANWAELRAKRKRTQNCVLEHVAELTQIPTGYRLRIRAIGTVGVPLAIEINLREGGKLEGCDEILSSGYATYSTPDASLRFGPGIGQHRWTPTPRRTAQAARTKRLPHRLHAVRSHPRIPDRLKTTTRQFTTILQFPNTAPKCARLRLTA